MSSRPSTASTSRSTDGDALRRRRPLLPALVARSRSRRSRSLEGYDDLDDDELAIACASHQAEPAQLDAVRKLLARAGATVDDLENGRRRAARKGSSATTARASTPGCSPRAARTAGRCTRTAICRIRCSSASPSCSAPARRRDRRLRRADVRDAARAHGERSSLRRRSGSATRCARGRSWSAASGARRHRSDARAARLDREGRRGGAALRARDGRDAWTLKVEDGATRALRPALGQCSASTSSATVDVSQQSRRSRRLDLA